MLHKVGDKVRIRSREWIDAHKKNASGQVKAGVEYIVQGMFPYAGRDANVVYVSENTYGLDIDGGCWCWTDEMLEEVPVV